MAKKTLLQQAEDAAERRMRESQAGGPPPAGLPAYQSSITEAEPDYGASSTQQSTTAVSGTRMTPGTEYISTPYTRIEEDVTPGGILYNLGKMYRDRRAGLERGLADETARQQRMARASAWGEFVKAIGNLAGGAAGGGHAPVPMQYDPSRTLAAFQAVDRLRAEQRDIDNDPMLSWLRNAEIGRMTALSNQRDAARQADAQALNSLNMQRYSESGTSSNTGRVSVAGTRRTDTYAAPQPDSGSGGSGGGNNYFTRIGWRATDEKGRGLNVPIGRDQALAIINDVLAAKGTPVTNKKGKVTGYTASNVDPLPGVPAEVRQNIYNEYGSTLAGLTNTIMEGNEETSNNAIENLVQMLTTFDKTGEYAKWALRQQGVDTSNIRIVGTLGSQSNAYNIDDLGLTD